MQEKKTEIKEEMRKKQFAGIKYGITTLIIEFIVLLIIGVVKKDMGTIATNAFLCVWIALGVMFGGWITSGLHNISKIRYVTIVIYIAVGIVQLILGSIALTYIFVNGELSWQSMYILMGLSSFATLVTFTLRNRKIKSKCN